MHSAIDLNDEPGLRAVKVDYEVSDGMLAPELISIQAAIREQSPQCSLGGCLPRTENASITDVVSTIRHEGRVAQAPMIV